ncbi:hypothetical protein scyTo_0005108 [Scyliorhinus torazame]|uniref:Calponin-homology (CH) domain-containing protein n=1 Tax=Scyliorhinus torazame TaxID=75743 RepID=A0A401P2F3_SCYTO|nr:hypothetical protein [Scyliorhinus torazame]
MKYLNNWEVLVASHFGFATTRRNGKIALSLTDPLSVLGKVYLCRNVTDARDGDYTCPQKEQNHHAVLDNERLTAEEMDERRRQNIAYEYLCHLEEAKRWMEACLDEELPPTTELEEGLRNGVYLAKLGNFFSPKVVSLKKIYDCEQTRYRATGLHFRHTDNTIQWFNAMSNIGLPKIFYPETTDIYDRKNMPRCIYCIHALSLYLFKLGLAPQIQDLYGKVAFTEEEINNMKKELEKYGIQMPAFSKIGGILANELSVDEAALHAAVIAINDAVEKGVPAETLTAMKNPNAMLVNLDSAQNQQYQNTLSAAKREKMTNARNKGVPGSPQEERDAYEELLTQAEIQGNVNKVNLQSCLKNVDGALDQGNGTVLYNALKSPALGLREVGLDNCDWYLKQLSSDRQLKAQEQRSTEPLTKEELQFGVDQANQSAQRFRKSEYMLLLSGNLTHAELAVAVEMLSSVAMINRSLEAGDVNGVWRKIQNPVTGLTNVDDGNAQRYVDELMRMKAKAGPEGNDFLTWNDIQASVDQVNVVVLEEHDRIKAIGLINEAVDEGDPQKTLKALLLPSAKLADVSSPVAEHYQETLIRTKREKAQVWKLGM